MATIDERGLVIDYLPDILSKIQYRLTQRLGPLVPSGQQLDFDESSILFRILAPIAELISEQEALLQEIAGFADPDQASGTKLDDLVRLGGVFRKLESPSEAMLMLRGKRLTTIPEGSFVSSSVTGDVFKTLSNVQLTTANINGAEFQLNSISEDTVITISWSITNNPNQNAPVQVLIESTLTAQERLSKLVENINSVSNRLTASITNDGLLKIIITDQNDVGTISVSNSTIVNVYKPVNSRAIVKGAREQAANTITILQSPILGWLGVTNPFSAVVGNNTQTDDELRVFYKRAKLSDGSGSYDNMYSQLTSLDGVKFVTITENKLGDDTGTLPAHTFAVVILGGDEDEIANAIFNNRPIGINDYGDESVTVVDINGNPNIVNFSRPDLIPIRVEISLQTTPLFPANGVTLIKQAIVDYFSNLKVGDDVYYSQLFTPINTVVGQSVNSLSISRKDENLSSQNIEIAFNELAIISAEDIKVV